MTETTPAPTDETGGAATEAAPARPSPTAVADTITATAPAATATAPAPTATARARRSVSGLIQTVGRRKEAIVRVRLVSGSGAIVCNGRPLESYFPSKVHQQLIKDPLTLTERVESVDVHANLRGGGTTGQAGALRLAIARALIELDIEHRPALKKAGFLTRDARATERKKYGLKKARKAPQYSKR
jgi:small subunit ribosomal protein S9